MDTDEAETEDSHDDESSWFAQPQTQKYLKAMRSQGKSFTTQLLHGYASMTEEQRAVLVGKINGIEIALLSANPIKAKS